MHQVPTPATATTPMPVGRRGPGGRTRADVVSTLRQLTVHRRDMAAEASGNGAGAVAFTGLDHDSGVSLVLEVLVALFHPNILPTERVGVALEN